MMAAASSKLILIIGVNIELELHSDKLFKGKLLNSKLYGDKLVNYKLLNTIASSKKQTI